MLNDRIRLTRALPLPDGDEIPEGTEGTVVNEGLYTRVDFDGHPRWYPLGDESLKDTYPDMVGYPLTPEEFETIES